MSGVGWGGTGIVPRARAHYTYDVTFLARWQRHGGGTALVIYHHGGGPTAIAIAVTDSSRRRFRRSPPPRWPPCAA